MNRSPSASGSFTKSFTKSTNQSKPQHFDSYEELLRAQKPPIEEDYDISDVELCLEEGEALVYSVSNIEPTDSIGYASINDISGIEMKSDDEIIEIEEKLPQPSTSDSNLKESASGAIEIVEDEPKTVEAPKEEPKNQPLPEFNPFKPQNVKLIDFGEQPQQQEQTPQNQNSSNGTVNDIDLLLGLSNTQQSKEQQIDLVTVYENDKKAFASQLVASDDITLSTTLFKLVQKHPDCGEYLLAMIQGSGPQARRLLTNIPPLPPSRFTDYIEQRKKFALAYSQFEGNFSLSEFTKLNKACPPPPGEPPICLDAVKQLQQAMDVLIFAFREKPSKLLQDEALSLYQIIAYIIAKLVQFNISKGYVQSTIIPAYRNQHNNLKKAFDGSKLQINFPTASFNFDDPNIIKRLRPPAAKILFV